MAWNRLPHFFVGTWPSGLSLGAAGTIGAALISVTACGCVREALLTAPAEEPAAEACRLVLDALLAREASDGVVCHGSHARRELCGLLSLSTACARQLRQIAPAGRALAAAVGVLLDQLCSGEGVLDLDDAASRALDPLLHGLLVVEIAFERKAAVLDLLAREAGGIAVGSDELPLRAGEQVDALRLLALVAAGFGPARLAHGFPVEYLAFKLPQEQFRTFGGAALEEPEREGPQDERVLSAANAAGHHGAVGGVRLAVHVEVEHDGRPGAAWVCECRFLCFLARIPFPFLPGSSVLPWLAWAVMAKAGTSGICFLFTSSTEYFLPLSRNHCRVSGTMG